MLHSITLFAACLAIGADAQDVAPAQVELVGNPYTTSQIHFMTEGATPSDPLDADKHSMIEQDRDGNLGISCGGAAALAAGG